MYKYKTLNAFSFLLPESSTYWDVFQNVLRILFPKCRTIYLSLFPWRDPFPTDRRNEYTGNLSQPISEYLELFLK